MLVSGREETEKSLESIQGLLDQVDSELILVDTGCGEELKKQLTKYTDRIIPFTWCNDFAEARNVGLKEAKGEWFLYLDDDEWFENIEAFVEFLNSEEEQEYDQAVYLQRNYSDKSGTAYSDDWVSRMIRVTEETHFYGKVHEQLLPAVGKCKKIDAYVHHYGYAYPDEDTRRKHFERNMFIMKSMMEEEPNNLRWKLQAIKEYWSINEIRNARQVVEDGIRLVQNQDKAFINLCRGVFYTAILRADAAEGKFADLVEHTRMYLQDTRNPVIVNCSLCGNAALELWESPKREDWLEIVAEFSKNYFEHISTYETEEKTEQQQIIEDNAIFVHLAVKEGMKRRMSITWAEVLAKLERQEEFSQECAKKIEEKVINDIAGKADFLFLPEEAWKMGELGLIPLEEILLNLPIDQWMAQIMVLESEGYSNKWMIAEQNLCRICTKEDIRYDYFNMHDVNQKIQSVFQLESNVEKMDQDALTQLLMEFIAVNLNYKIRVYTEEASQGDMEILPDYIRAATYLGEAMMYPKEWSMILECLRKSAGAWKPLGQLAKRAAYFVGEAQKRAEEEQNQKAQVAKNQLQQMAAQVLNQVEQLQQQGEYIEALGIIRQLRQMLPEDARIEKMEKQLEEANAGK